MKFLLIAGGCGAIIFTILYLFISTMLKKKEFVQERLQSINKYPDKFADNTSNTAAANPEGDTSLTQRVFLPLYHNIERHLLAFAPHAIRQSLAQRIIYAGKQNIWSVNAVATAWVLSMGTGFLLAFLYVSHTSTFTFAQRIIILLLGLSVGALLPFSALNTIIRRRQKLILHQLPEVLDLLCVSVQAGLSFDASLMKITTQMTGPYIDECEKMLRDVRMGMTRRTALQNLSKRCNLQEVHLFTTAVIQSEKLGTSMSKTLLAQADNTRERRMQSAKAAALKAPIKILFPLILFIFPALFVIVLMPSLLVFIKSMHP